METRTLRYFLAIAREENMTNAANLLHISQSALSRSMADLEAELGKTLFIRTNRRTLLTEDGMRLRQRAEEIVSLLDKTEAEFRSPDDRITGEVHIGAGEGRSFSLIARAMRQTQEKYPGITFFVHSANSVDTIERLEHGTLDFGLLFREEPSERYEVIRMPFTEPMGLLVRHDHPYAEKNCITEEDLSDIPLLVSSRFSADSVLTHLSEKARHSITIRGYYNLINNASLMVEEGIGCAISLEHLIYAGENSPFRFLPFSPEKKIHTVFVWKKYQLLSKACEAFLHELKEVCAEQ